jgi:transcriptional regulator with XRE-family HTH domain
MARPLTSAGHGTVDPIDRHVGRRLKLRRALMGLSQERLGDLLGVTFQQVQKYERGANRIGAGRLWQLAGILSVPVTWFFEELGTGDADRDVAARPAPGLAEPGVGFVFEPPRRAVPSAQPPSVDRRETLELVRAFNEIGDPVVRRRLYELVRAVSDARTELRPADRRST